MKELDKDGLIRNTNHGKPEYLKESANIFNKKNIYKCHKCSYRWHNNTGDLLCKKFPHPFRYNCYRICSEININGSCKHYMKKNIFEKLSDFIFGE